jgi:hypothetical protein
VAACCGVILDRLDEPESSSMTRAAKRSTCGEDCDWRVRMHEIHQKFSKK